MKIVNFSIFLDKMGENNITRGLNMFYVIDSIDNNGRKSYEILTENELDINGKQQNVNENEIHSFSNIDEVVKYCAKRRSINLGEEVNAYSNLYVFLKIL